MNLPSIRTIQGRLNTTVEVARAIRAELEKGRGKYFQRGCSRHVIETLEEIDRILARWKPGFSHGVESISAKGGAVVYCNRGETYAQTIYFDHKIDRFVVGNWGDLVEAYPSRFSD